MAPLDSPAKRLKWAREQHGKYPTPSEAAAAFGWKQSTYLGHENGDRNPSRKAAIRYARAYGVRWEWILEGDGRPTDKPAKVRVLGEVIEGSEVRRSVETKFISGSDVPPNVGVNSMALEVRGGSMRGIADDGWLLFFDDLRQPPTPDLLGKLCVLEVGDGRILVRVLQRARIKNRYDLESPAERTLRDQRVTWAARVTWIKPR